MKATLMHIIKKLQPDPLLSGLRALHMSTTSMKSHADFLFCYN